MLREQSTAKASRAGAIIAIATLAAAVVVLDEVGAWHHGIHIASPTPIAGLEGQILEGQTSLRTVRAVRTALARVGPITLTWYLVCTRKAEQVSTCAAPRAGGTSWWDIFDQGLRAGGVQYPVWLQRQSEALVDPAGDVMSSGQRLQSVRLWPPSESLYVFARHRYLSAPSQYMPSGH
jgi:hypothetical protein